MSNTHGIKGNLIIHLDLNLMEAGHIRDKILNMQVKRREDKRVKHVQNDFAINPDELPGMQSSPRRYPNE